MFHADTLFDNEESFGLPEIEERDLSASLTLRWSRKRKRWECRNAFFWQDAKNKWSCRSQDGRYYYGFRSLRAMWADFCARSPSATVPRTPGQNTGSARTPDG